jgi:hypothetical protein
MFDLEVFDHFAFGGRLRQLNVVDWPNPVHQNHAAITNYLVVALGYSRVQSLVSALVVAFALPSIELI